MASPTVLNDDTVAMLAKDSTFYRQQVKAELFKLQVRQEARSLFEYDSLGGEMVELPTGVLAYDPLPPEPAELFPGYLLAKGANLISAQKETGKTATALETASSLLTGDPLWGHIAPTRTIKRAVHMLGEHSAQTVQGLFHRMELPHKGDLRIYGPEDMKALKHLVVNGVIQRAALSLHKRLAEGAEFIVYDPLGSFVQGLGAEQDNPSMRLAIDSMIEVANSTGAALLILAHTGKPKQDENGDEIQRKSYATRGASSQEDACAAVHYLRSATIVQQQGEQNVMELVPRHFKGQKGKPFRLLTDAKTVRHTLLTGARPSRDVRAMEFELALATFQQEHPDVNKTDAVKQVAKERQITERTAWNYLQGSDA